MYVPEGFAHGYQALTDGAAVHYMVSAHYAPDHEAGIHYADRAIGINWPLPVTAVSPKDAKLPSLR
jgi:dTDP-4-dehydrorhamnose 3,5-epimerase